MKTSPATQIFGRMVLGRLHMTTEAECPKCKAKATYVHIESHVSPGQWYACKHISSAHYDDQGYIDEVEFSNA